MDRTELQPPTDALKDIAIESWRFIRLVNKLLADLDAGTQGRYRNQVRYFLKKLDTNLEAVGLKVVSLEGDPFDPGMAATAINVEDFEEGDELVVDQMIEPVIMGPDGLVHTGTVLLRKVSR